MGQGGYDAVVVGSGPNGLAAAVEIARHGRSVIVYEAAEAIGGGARTAELTLPGFRHDVCSAVHPMAIASPFFRRLPLASHGLEWIHPTVPLAHPLEDGTAAVLARSVDATADSLGPDGPAYRRLLEPLVLEAEAVTEGFLAPPLQALRHPLAAARLGTLALRGAAQVAEARFRGGAARALFAGAAAHAILPLHRPPTAAVGVLLLLLGHAAGWPVARGGSQAIVEALASYLRSLGGEIRCGHPVRSMGDLPPARVYLFDVAPRRLAAIAAGHLPPRYRRRLEAYRHGPAVFKVDWALDGPIPWRAEACAGAGTVHLGTYAEIVEGEAAVARGAHPPRPWTIIAQQSRFDPSRAPAGKHTAWGYCHVPPGSAVDMTEAIERQVERFAPGFRDLVLARRTTSPADLQRYNENYVGGDIACGATDLRQILARPALRLNPYATPNPAILLCSAATPPGPGVHGMCGFFAARTALARLG